MRSVSGAERTTNTIYQRNKQRSKQTDKQTNIKTKANKQTNKMSSSSTDRSEVNYMEVPELKPFSEWKKTPVASFTEEEKYISSWDMDTSSALLTGGSERQIVFWINAYEELTVQPTDGAPMAATDMRQFRNIVMKSLNTRLHTSGLVKSLTTDANKLMEPEYNMDALCTFFDVLNPTDTNNFNGTAAEAVWIKTDLHQMFVQLLTAVMKHLFPSVYKYKGHDGIFDNHIMEVIMPKSRSTDNWTGWEDHQLMLSKVRETLACMGCQTIIAIHLVYSVVSKFRSWWDNACEEAAVEEAKRKAEASEAIRRAAEAQAAAAEFMAKFQQLDPVVRTLVESQFQPAINPLLQVLQQLQQPLQQITSPLQQQNPTVEAPTKGSSSSEKDGASSSSAITTTTTTKKDAKVEDKLSLTDWISIDSRYVVAGSRGDPAIWEKEYTYSEYMIQRTGLTCKPKTSKEIQLAHEARKKMNIKEYSFCEEGENNGFSASEDEDEEEEGAKKSNEEKEIEENGLVIVDTPTKEKGYFEKKFPNHKEILDGEVMIQLKKYIAFEKLRCGDKISGTSFTFEQIDHNDLCVEATLMTKRDAVYKSITSLNLKHEQWDTIFSEAAENYDINVEVDEKKDWTDAEKCHVYDLVTFEDPNSSHHGTKFYIVGMDVDALDAELLFVDTPLADNLEGIALKDLEHYEEGEDVYPKTKSRYGAGKVGKKHGKTLAVPSPMKNLDKNNIVSGKRKAPKPDHFVAGSATNTSTVSVKKKRIR